MDPLLKDSQMETTTPLLSPWLLLGATALLGFFWRKDWTGLLLVAFGSVAAWIASALGQDTPEQFFIFLVACIGFEAVQSYLEWKQRSALLNRQGVPMPGVGETIQIDRWEADRQARVHFRGADWFAIAPGTDMPEPGLYVVTAYVGNQLFVNRV